MCFASVMEIKITTLTHVMLAVLCSILFGLLVDTEIIDIGKAAKILSDYLAMAV